VTRVWRLVIFTVVMVVVVFLVTLTDGDYAHAARHFLSSLLRHLF
jgi:hypothetical protein